MAPLDFNIDREIEQRGGTRGGRSEFSWDAVRVDKHIDNYLGHSVMAPIGRWQNNRDIHFYSREKTTEEDGQRKKEIKRIKRAEEDALSAALGFAPSVRPLSDSEDETKAIGGVEDEQARDARRKERAERRARKEERRKARESKEVRRRDRRPDDDRERRADDRDRSPRRRSRSPPRRRSPSPPRRRYEDDRSPARTDSRSSGRIDDREAAMKARRAALAAQGR